MFCTFKLENNILAKKYSRKRKLSWIKYKWNILYKWCRLFGGKVLVKNKTKQKQHVHSLRRRDCLFSSGLRTNLFTQNTAVVHVLNNATLQEFHNTLKRNIFGEKRRKTAYSSHRCVLINVFNSI